MDIRQVEIAALNTDDRNARVHGEKNIKETMRSLQEFGQHAPLVVQRSTGKVLVGNGRLEAMRRLGWTQAAVFYVDDDNKTALRRALADNRTAELAEWDDDLLKDLIAELGKDVIGWDEIDLGKMFDDDEAMDDDFDISTAMPETPETQMGELIELGNHRLVCGDSTDAELMSRLMNGEQAALVLTDLPYNVNYGDKAEYLNEYLETGGNRNTSHILNDYMSGDDFYELLLGAFTLAREFARPGAGIYIFHSEQEGIAFRKAMADAGWKQAQCLIWAKNTFVLGRQDYHWQHEPILYGWKEGAGHYFCGDRTQSTVIDDSEPADLHKMKKEQLLEYAEALRAQLHADETTVLRENRPSRNDEHPTMKPVALCGRLIKNSTGAKGEVVLDMFGGSGSTMIAAEQLGRRCFMVELDPAYCDVIATRWERLTGKKAKRHKARGTK